MHTSSKMASSRKELNMYPALYEYNACFTRPRIIDYFSINENSELAENLSYLKYVTGKPGVINLDINIKEKKSKIKQSEPFFEFITNHKEIIQRYTGTKIEDAGFVFGRTTLMNIGNALYDKYNTFMLCAHLLRGVIYVYHDKKIFESNDFQLKKFHQFCCSSKIDDSNPNVHETFEKTRKFVTVVETNLKQHNILHRSELTGLDANDEQFQKKIPLNLEKKLVIDELNKRNNVELTISKFCTPDLTINKTRRVWVKSFWGRTNKILCGFTTENGIVIEIKSYNPSELEDMGKGMWKEQGILNFTAELLTFIKDCFKEKLKSEDITTANQRLYFRKVRYGDIELTEKEDFYDIHWIPDWYINNEPIPQECIE